MTDDELLEQFEDTSLPLASFHHEEHVRVAFLYLRKYPLLDVLARFPANLQRFAAAHGKAGLYHQTISWAYLFLISERIAANDGAKAWHSFKEQNPDVLDRTKPILAKYYRTETLASPAARERFVMPDRLVRDDTPVYLPLIRSEV
ncbi:MAG TPA: hypothetical protein VGD60_19780 [Candidatus Acidoferrales bacterium]